MISITNPPEQQDTRDKTLLCKMSYTQPNPGIHSSGIQIGNKEKELDREWKTDI